MTISSPPRTSQQPMADQQGVKFVDKNEFLILSLVRLGLVEVDLVSHIFERYDQLGEALGAGHDRLSSATNNGGMNNRSGGVERKIELMQRTRDYLPLDGEVSNVLHTIDAAVVE